MSAVNRRREWMAFWIVSSLLVVLALIQISMIFWEGTTQKSGEPLLESTMEDYSLIEPQNIYLSIRGNRDFLLIPDETGDQQLLAGQAMDLLRLMMPSAMVQAYGASEKRIDRILPGTVMVMDLEQFRTSEELRAEFSLPENRVPAGSFDQIWLVPALSVMEDVTVCFLNTQTGSVLEAVGGAYLTDENRDILRNIMNLASSVDADHLWQNDAFDGSFEKQGFVRIAGHQSGARGSLDSPFLVDGAPAFTRMRRYGMSFFEFPDTVSERIFSKDGAENSDTAAGFFFSNEKVTVRLSSDGHLIYVETLTELEKEPVSLDQAYDIAVSFISRDMGFPGGEKASWTLRETRRSGSDYVFCFDYKLDGLLLNMDRYLQDHTQMEAPLIVTVRGSKVCRYERMLTALQQEEPAVLRYTWMEVADQCAAEGIELLAPPALVYEASFGQIFLYWKIETPEGYLYRFAI